MLLADWIAQVVTSQGDEVFFKIKRNTKLTKLRSAYANKVGKDLASIRCVYYLIGGVWASFWLRGRRFTFDCIYSCSSWLYRALDEVSLTNLRCNRFLYDGQRIQDDDSPNSLDMEDNDTIDVMVERASAFS